MLQVHEYAIQWDSATWAGRIDLLKNILGINTDAELARYLGKYKQDVYAWRKGTRAPGKKRDIYLRDLYLQSCLKQDNTAASDSTVACALSTCAIDNTDPIFRTAISFSDMMTVYNMINALCVKFAHRIVVDLHVNCIPKAEYHYGACPARTRLTLNYVEDSSKKVEFIFTHTTREPIMYLVHVIPYINDRKHSEYTFVANDAALIAVTSRVIKFFKSKTYGSGR